ncbi:MAG: polysulfide reductase NrfD [Myxococcota bacterium]|nr:polysulfide reductase NrfD [Myxococcota bacterium]
MNYGFVIDNRKCIGCHACSTACKSENDVPLGVNRTWVKSVEIGLYPDVRRNFQVTRCNHCANPPCVRICPTAAMYQRDDGIVEFNNDSCIGCKACMQACPYDAIHIDPETKTAAKCHFCSHRIEIGLEPACVVVCPEHAIVSGDMDDPATEISRIIAGHQTTVRKPEQGTAPKVLYINGSDVSLHPGAAPTPKTFAAADVITKQHGGTPPKQHSQGVPMDPIQVGVRVAGQMAQLHYNAQHEVPWHWPVPAYLVTKGIGAGAFGFLSLGLLTGAIAYDSLTVLLGGALGILATLITTGLLVYDLERPERFLYILTRPQWRSWLTRGAFLLIGFSAVSGLWWGLELASWMGVLSLPSFAQTGLALLTLPLAVGTAVYTAFLFAQAEGRDLWQSPLMPLHLLIQALMMGAASFLLLSPVAAFDADLIHFARWVFGAALVTDAAATLMGEFGIAHASEQAARAAHEISHGRYSRQFWLGAMVLGHVVPLLLLAANLSVLSALAAVCAGVGLYFYEHALVMAPQELPNS